MIAKTAGLGNCREAELIGKSARMDGVTNKMPAELGGSRPDASDKRRGRTYFKTSRMNPHDMKFGVLVEYWYGEYDSMNWVFPLNIDGFHIRNYVRLSKKMRIAQMDSRPIMVSSRR